MAEALGGLAGEGDSRGAGAWQHGDGHQAGDVLPAFPAWELAQIISPHQPDELRARKTLAQGLQRIGGEAGAEPIFDVGGAQLGMGTQAFR